MCKDLSRVPHGAGMGCEATACSSALPGMVCCMQHVMYVLYSALLFLCFAALQSGKQ
jgi:hypothetical protein